MPVTLMEEDGQKEKKCRELKCHGGETTSKDTEVAPFASMKAARFGGESGIYWHLIGHPVSLTWIKHLPTPTFTHETLV